MPRLLGVAALLVVALACSACSPPPKRALPAEMPRQAFPDMRNASDGGASDAGAGHETDAEHGSFRSLVVDESGAYWIADGHTVLAQDKASTKARVLAKLGGRALGLALGPSSVHILEADAPGAEGGVVALSRATGERTSVAKLRGASLMTVDGSYAYLVVGDKQVWRVLLDGGAPPKFFAESPAPKDAASRRNDANGAAVRPPGPPTAAPIRALAIDDTALYAVTTDAFLRIPRSTSTPGRMGPAPSGVHDLVLTKTHLFVLASDPQATTPELWLMPKAGPADAAERIDGDDEVRSLVSDGNVVHWLGCTGGKDGKPASCAVRRRGATGATTTVGSVSEKATSIAVHASRIHVATPDGVTVLAPKK